MSPSPFTPATIPSGSAGSLAALSDATLSGAAATIDVQNISQAYAHLWIVLSGKADTAALNVLMRFNNDSGANYDWGELYVTTGPAAGAAQNTGTTSGGIAYTGTTAGGDPFSVDILVPLYGGATFAKYYRALASGNTGAAANQSNPLMRQGRWRTANAITRVTFLLSAAGNFAIGTRCTVYGLAAS